MQENSRKSFESFAVSARFIPENELKVCSDFLEKEIEKKIVWVNRVILVISEKITGVLE